MPMNGRAAQRLRQRRPVATTDDRFSIPQVDPPERRPATLPQRRFMNPGEIETIIGLLWEVQPKTVLEFGINTGRTAQAILQHVLGITHYIGVDVLPGYVTTKEVQRGEVPEVAGELVQGDPRVTLLTPPNGSLELDASNLPMVDAVFIDGDHSRAGVTHDTGLARSRITPGGIIIWHDYHTLGTVDVREVLNEMYTSGWVLRHVKNSWLVYWVAPGSKSE